MSDLRFQPPPDWLLQAYVNRPQPAELASQGLGQAVQSYASLKQQQETSQLAQQAKDIEMAKGMAANGQDFMDAYSKIVASRTSATKTPFQTPRAPTALGGTLNPDTVNPVANEHSPYIAASLAMGHSPIQGLDYTPYTQPLQSQPPTPSTGTVKAPITTNIATDPLVQEYQRDPLAFKKQHGPLGVDKLTKQANLDKSLNPESKDYTTDQATKLLKGNLGAADVIASFPKDKVPRDVVHLMISQGKQDLNVGTKESQQQDKLEEQYRKSFQQIRGDPALKRTEEQRDAAATVYNRIKDVKARGQILNPIDYIDSLGQVYKARTGTAPTETVLQEARQATLKGNFGKAFTFLTGEQAPATTADIMNSLQDMALHMGQQADKFHDGYMRSRMRPPKGLAHDRVANVDAERGMSFAESTGQNNQSSGGLTPEEQAEMAQLDRELHGR